jgi:hypothetical protein
MARGSPKAQEYQAAERALFCQRVEPPSHYYGVPGDNAFHLGQNKTSWKILTRQRALIKSVVSQFISGQTNNNVPAIL